MSRKTLLSSLSMLLAAMLLWPAESVAQLEAPFEVEVPYNVRIRRYFPFMDSLVAAYAGKLPYTPSEHLIVWANPWIIDSLAHTDYYYMMARDSFVYDQKSLVILPKGTKLLIPGELQALVLRQEHDRVRLELNIPEYLLRVYRGDSVEATFLVRVGRDERKYLALAKNTISLRTATGSGTIVRIERNPIFINPTDGKRFTHTRRDDNRTTLMPQIPWIEPELNKIRHGHLIHPTTNPKTLGKAYSNGCIGVGEGDAWRIYYYAPVGTPIRVYYELEVQDTEGNPVLLKDIYGFAKKK